VLNPVYRRLFAQPCSNYTPTIFKAFWHIQTLAHAAFLHGTLESKAVKSKKEKKNKKEAQILIRLDETMRDEFSAACADLDTTASREIRRFIKRFLARYEKGELDDK